MSLPSLIRPNLAMLINKPGPAHLDRFNVLPKANAGLEKVRKRIRKGLTAIPG